MKAYAVPSYSKAKEALMYEDDNSGTNKNAQILGSFFPQTNAWGNKVIGGYKIRVTHASYNGTGEYDILLKQTGKFEEQGFKDGDHTIIYAINDRGSYPFLVKLTANSNGQLLPSFVESGDAERFKQLNSPYVTAAQFMSLAISFTPLDVPKDLADFIAGKDTFTGEDLDRWLLAACIITPEIVDQGIKLYGKNADDIAKFIKNGGEILHLSKNATEHILTNHTYTRMSTTIKVMMDKGLTSQAQNLLVKKTFFNPTWSNEKVIEAVEIAYNRALVQGIKNGPFQDEVFGEIVKLEFKNGILNTAYGAHKLSLSDFGY